MFPPQLRAPRQHRGNVGLFKMRVIANSYFWWQHMDRKIQITAKNCKECIKSGKILKFVIFSTDIANSDPTKEAKQEILVDFLSILPFTWGANKYLLNCVDDFSKIPPVQITTRTTVAVIKQCVENYITVHAIPRVIRTEQGSGIEAESTRQFFTQHNIQLILSSVGMHRATGLVER